MARNRHEDSSELTKSPGRRRAGTMAPVSVTGTGVPRQRIDDPELRSLLARLARFDPRKGGDGSAVPTDDGTKRRAPPVDVDGLVSELGAVGKWRFQEQVSSRPRRGPFRGPADVQKVSTRIAVPPRWIIARSLDAFANLTHPLMPCSSQSLPLNFCQNSPTLSACPESAARSDGPSF